MAAKSAAVAAGVGVRADERVCVDVDERADAIEGAGLDARTWATEWTVSDTWEAVELVIFGGGGKAEPLLGRADLDEACWETSATRSLAVASRSLAVASGLSVLAVADGPAVTVGLSVLAVTDASVDSRVTLLTMTATRLKRVQVARGEYGVQKKVSKPAARRSASNDSST